MESGAGQDMGGVINPYMLLVTAGVLAQAHWLPRHVNTKMTSNIINSRLTSVSWHTQRSVSQGETFWHEDIDIRHFNLQITVRFSIKCNLWVVDPNNFQLNQFAME